MSRNGVIKVRTNQTFCGLSSNTNKSTSSFRFTGTENAVDTAGSEDTSSTKLASKAGAEKGKEENAPHSPSL